MKRIIAIMLMISMLVSLPLTAYGATIAEMNARISAIDKEIEEIEAKAGNYDSEIAKYESNVVIATMSTVLSTSPKFVVKGTLIGVGPIATGIQYAVIENPNPDGLVFGTYTGEHYIKRIETMYVDGYNRSVYILGDYPKEVKNIVNKYNGYADAKKKAASGKR